jgi:hypothetical protein
MEHARKLRTASALLVVVAVGMAFAGSALGSGKRQSLATQVQITFTDSSLAVAPGTLTTQLASFDVALVMVNHGKKPHVVTIKGPGLSGSPLKTGVRTQLVGPGSSATLRLKLLTGAYQLSENAGSKAVRWLVVRPATVAGAGANTQAPPVKNPDFSPGNSATNSSMDCL